MVTCVRGEASMSREEHDAYHLIGEDSVDAVVVERDHPVETLDLVVSHLTSLDV